jgi:hypothetical protein
LRNQPIQDTATLTSLGVSQVGQDIGGGAVDQVSVLPLFAASSILMKVQISAATVGAINMHAPTIPAAILYSVFIQLASVA